MSLKASVSSSPNPTLSPPLSSRPWKGRRKWNSLITNPSLWTKKEYALIREPLNHCIKHTYTTSLPLHNLNTLNSISRSNHTLSLRHSCTQSVSLFLSPRMPCRFIWLGTPAPPSPPPYFILIITSLYILMIIVSVINEKIDNLTTGRSFM